MNVLHAIPIPMPDGDWGKALVWRLEAKYMAVSANGEELSFIDEDELANCFGSQKYAICNKTFPTEQTYQSCISLYHDYCFSSNRRYNLRRNDHLALAQENSLYNLLQPSEKEKEEQVKVITYFPLDYIPDPNLKIDTTETDQDESIADSQATSSQSRYQSFTDFTFD